MDLTRTAPGLVSPRVEPVLARGADVDADASMANLAARLAQQGVELAAVELRRIGAEVRERQRHAVRAAVALYLITTAAGVGIAVLSTASVLYLGRQWDDYAGGALATGVVLLALAAAASCIFKSAARRLGAGPEAEHQPTRSDERNPRDVS